LRRLLGAAVGAALERGDTVVVQSLRGWVTDPQTSAPSVDSTLDASTTAAVGKVAVTRPNAVLSPMTVSVFALTICAAVLLAWLFRRRFRSDSGVHATALNQAEREVLLQRVKEWMRNTPPSKMDMRESSSGASL
jgi:flagellar M-ring protein FliF